MNIDRDELNRWNRANRRAREEYRRFPIASYGTGPSEEARKCSNRTCQRRATNHYRCDYHQENDL